MISTKKTPPSQLNAKTYNVFRIVLIMCLLVARARVRLLILITASVQEFGLIDKKELAPLQELIESIIAPY